MDRFPLFLVLGTLVLASPLFSQAVAPEGGGTDPGTASSLPAPQASPPPPVDTRVTELQTAGYYELVARARELGLATTGSLTDLRARVAQALGLTLPDEAPASERTLTIDSAREAGLVDVDAPDGGKLLRMSGGLKVTLVDKEKKVTHVIEASELWYDQANEEMTARGNVVYTMVRETSKEVFRGESLTFRLSDSQGVFYQGASDRERTVDTKTLTFRYGGQAVRRSAGDLVVLDAGSITSSLGAEPNYRIRATKIWVLAPGEWGLQDAVLYLGRVPVLYFPFFFQPGDEFFFNPVLSFPDSSDRRGTSLQTTTYFWGKKKQETSPLSFLQLADAKAEDSDRVQRGLFLVRGKAPLSTIPSGWLLKYTADFYSNLGFLTGVEVSAPGAWSLKGLGGSGGIGITRSVGSDNLPFSANPFQAALDPWAQSDWNGSWIGQSRLPFRWGGQIAVDAGWGSVGLEYYSDPLLYNDLTGSRSENFSVFSLLGLGPAKKTATASAKSSLNWTSALTLGPAKVGASLLWDSKTVPAALAGPNGDPENSFYLPSQLTLPQVSVSLQGTLWPPGAPSSPTSAEGKKTGASAALLIPPGDTGEGRDEPPANNTEPSVAPAPMAPDKMDSVTLPAAVPGWTAGASWSLAPTFKTDTRFNPAAVQVPSDTSWDVLTSRWSGAYDAKLSLSGGRGDGSLTVSDTLTLRQQAQDTWYRSTAVTGSESLNYDRQDKLQNTGLLAQTLASTWKPFVAGGPWRESSLQYTLGTKLWEDTSVRTLTFDGTKDTVTAHQASAQAVWYLWEGTPTLKTQGGWTSTLAPLDPLRTYTSSTDLSFPWAKASTRVSARQSETRLTWDPWDSSAEWTPLTGLSLRESFQYDLENARPQTSTTVLSAWGLTAQYRQQRTTPYRFDTTARQWVTAGAQDFVPQELRFTYVFDLPEIRWWLSRESLSSKVNFSWPLNLQQYSDMPLVLGYTVNYKLYRFLDLQLAGGVQNKTAYRYFPALVETFGPGVVTPVNPLVDLWDSISLWDQAALQRTGFKMTTLSLSLVHYLDDWQIKLAYNGAPQLNTAGTQYTWTGTLSVLIQWYPIPELKTQMDWDKKGTLTIAKNGS